jgi:HK97 family phage major capsid protein
MTIQELQADLIEKQDRARALLGRVRKDDGSVAAPNQALIDDAARDIRSARERLQRAKGDADMMAQLEDITGGRRKATRVDPGAGGVYGSIGEQFINSATYKWLTDEKSARGERWHAPASEMQLPGLMATTLSSDPASGGDLVLPDFRPGIIQLPTTPLMIADLFAQDTTTSNLVSYMKETTFTNAAAQVAEGGTKPESTLVFDAVTDKVEKAAHWIPATDEMLEDVPSLRGYINARLRMGVNLVIDDQLMNGDGTSPNISGILDRVGLAADVAMGADTPPDAIQKQISAIETATNLPVSGIVIHPTNWGAIQRMKDANGQYYGGGPFGTPAQRFLWGKPVAVSTRVSAGTAVVGAFSTGGAQIFWRNALRVDATNTHADHFVKNLWAIRGERRYTLAVYVPASFGKVTGL